MLHINHKFKSRLQDYTIETGRLEIMASHAIDLANKYRLI